MDDIDVSKELKDDACPGPGLDAIFLVRDVEVVLKFRMIA